MPEYHGDLTEQRWFDSLKDYSFAAVIETYYRLMAMAEGATIWGDKTPQYLTNIALLKSLYGSARFIHMVRDVRDVVVSNQRAWGAHPLRCAQVWADQLLECVTQSSKLPAGEFLTVRYESLLTDTEGVLRQACQLMGVDFENGMLSLDRPVETVGRARQAGIAKANFGKWRDALSSEQVAMIESVALDTMNALEYETSDSRSRKRIGKTMMSWLKVRGVIGRFAYDVGEQDGLIKALVYRYNKRRYR